MDANESRRHPLWHAHLEWARHAVAFDPDEARGIARTLGEHIAVDPTESVRAVLSSLRDAILDELDGQGHV